MNGDTFVVQIPAMFADERVVWLHEVCDESFLRILILRLLHCFDYCLGMHGSQFCIPSLLKEIHNGMECPGRDFRGMRVSSDVDRIVKRSVGEVLTQKLPALAAK
ncbi:hypothetical protein C451_06725 [Halococcus thailandensis JCM 13552]|uniref:Uncharacterized protein n=1 Tax=Halococcus thailandensis JCM 13552 TaxID=1227457 RepID=M0N8M8_9EURY|nr:hypothetical protein C451_06725 [Halococcus thailandensis JCM 13552]